MEFEGQVKQLSELFATAKEFYAEKNVLVEEMNTGAEIEKLIQHGENMEQLIQISASTLEKLKAKIKLEEKSTMIPELQVALKLFDEEHKMSSSALHSLENTEEQLRKLVIN